MGQPEVVLGKRARKASPATILFPSDFHKCFSDSMGTWRECSIYLENSSVASILNRSTPFLIWKLYYYVIQNGLSMSHLFLGKWVTFCACQKDICGIARRTLRKLHTRLWFAQRSSMPVKLGAHCTNNYHPIFVILNHFYPVEGWSTAEMSDRWLLNIWFLTRVTELILNYDPIDSVTGVINDLEWTSLELRRKMSIG